MHFWGLRVLQSVRRYQVIAGSVINLFLLLCMLIGLLCSFIPLPVCGYRRVEVGFSPTRDLCLGGGTTAASQCDFLHQRMFRSDPSPVHVCMCATAVVYSIKLFVGLCACVCVCVRARVYVCVCVCQLSMRLCEMCE